MRRSYSQAHLMGECGEKYRLERIVKAPQRPAVWFAGGKAFHDTTEWFDRISFRADTTVVQASRRKLADVWAEKFGEHVEAMRQQEPDEKFWRTAGRPTKDKPNGEDVEWWREHGLQMTLAYPDAMSATGLRTWALPDGKPAIEVPILVNLGGVEVVQYIDRIWEADWELDWPRLIIGDLKTGSSEPPFPIQLAQYALGAQKAFGDVYQWGAYYMARPAQLTEFKPLSSWTEQVIGRQFAAVDKADREGIYLPNIGRHCLSCGVKRWCVYTGGQEYVPVAA